MEELHHVLSDVDLFNEIVAVQDEEVGPVPRNGIAGLEGAADREHTPQSATYALERNGRKEAFARPAYVGAS